MTVRPSMSRGWTSGVILLLAVLLAGCFLDRSGTFGDPVMDAALPDAAADAGPDAAQPDAAQPDAAQADAARPDAAGTDAGFDAGTDAGFDAGTDAGFDACVPDIEVCDGDDDDCDSIVDDGCIPEIGPTAPWSSASFASTGSSIYFVMENGAYGPAEPTRVWWGTDRAWTTVRIPIVRADGTGGADELVTRASHSMDGSPDSTCTNPVPMTCELNAGRCAGYTHSVLLEVVTADNSHLTTGVRYVTDAAAPAVIEARRWHMPSGRMIVGTATPAFVYVHSP